MKFYIMDRLYGEVVNVNELEFESKLEKDNGVFYSGRLMSEVYIGDSYMFIMMKQLLGLQFNKNIIQRYIIFFCLLGVWGEVYVVYRYM